MSPTAKDRKLLARFKTEVAKDVCRLLGASRVAFPDSDADLNIAIAQ